MTGGAGEPTGATIARATPGDVPAVLELLAAAGLPGVGAAEAFADLGAVARAGGRVVGAAAVERHGAVGLLRSVVVAPERRGTGLGRALVAAAEATAADAGVRTLYLLTETASDWFPRLGWHVVPRGEVDAAAPGSPEVAGACGVGAVAMRRDPARGAGTVRA